MNTFLLTLHVVAAVFIVGPMAILPQTALRAIRAGQGGMVEVLARSTMIFTLISLVVAVLGFGALGTAPKKDGLTITTPWLLSALAAYLVAFAVSMFVVVPALRGAADHLQASAVTASGTAGGTVAGGTVAGGTVAGGTAAGGTGARTADYRRIAIGSGVVSLLLVVVTVLMVWKP